MCRIRKILVLADQYTELFGHFTYALLRKIRLHFLLKSLLPWSLVFESSYPVLPEHLSTQSFVLKKKKRSNDGLLKKGFFHYNDYEADLNSVLLYLKCHRSVFPQAKDSYLQPGNTSSQPGPSDQILSPQELRSL